jgi:hypothetical protein
MALAERLDAVRERIDAACARAGRDPSSVTLVAVGKRHPVERIREAWEAGQRAFGENYVQELVEKAEALADLDGLRWHFIGHLQRNKAKFVVAIGATGETVTSETVTVETVDGAKLADELDRRAAALGRVVPVLLEVNVGREAQKSGCAPAELPALVERVRSCAQLRLRGLMTVPPFDLESEATRPIFRELASLAAAHGLRELSMGMSADLEVAIEEGATIVRVGTAIFGPRD